MAKVGRKNLKKRKRRVDIALIISILVFVCIGLLLAIRLYKNSLFNKPIVNTLYSYLGSNDLNICGGLNVYQGRLIALNDLEEENMLCNSYIHIDRDNIDTKSVNLKSGKKYCIYNNIQFNLTEDGKTCNVDVISGPDVIQKYREIYGYYLEKYLNFDVDYSYSCIYSDGFYYCGSILNKNYNISINLSQKVYRKIYDVEEKGNNIIIYDYFIKLNNNKCFIDYDEKTENLECSNFISSNNITEDNLDKYAAKYKHVFEKNGAIENSYNWLTSELIK